VPCREIGTHGLEGVDLTGDVQQMLVPRAG
jgi:hypothetical protein